MADKKVTILIVEDGRDWLDMFQIWFSDHLDVIEPVYASTLEDARVKFAAMPYDIVVTDGQYPDSSISPINKSAGLIFLAELQQLSFAGQVIYLSSSDQHLETIKSAGYAQAYSKGVFGPRDIVKMCLALTKRPFEASHEASKQN